MLSLFIAFSWVGERTAFPLFHGEVAEELAEFGAYMMMFYLTRDAEKRLRAEAHTELSPSSHFLIRKGT